jgi:hypothetical protein
LRFSRALSDEAVSALGVRLAEEPGTYLCEATDAAALNALIDEARRRGAELVELRPEMTSLEDILQGLLGKRS